MVYFAGAQSSVNGEEPAVLYFLAKILMGLVGIVWAGLLLAHLFICRRSGILRENRDAGRKTSSDEPDRTVPPPPVQDASFTGLISFVSALALVVCIVVAFCIFHFRSPSLFEVVERGTSVELNEHLAADPSEINEKNRKGFAPLVVAIEAGRVDMVECLLSHGALVDAVDRGGRTALIHATGKPILVEQLLEKGADANAVDAAGMTALHWAMRRYCKESAQLLLQYGAQGNVRNSESDTPLLMAVKNRFDVVDLLLMHGANPNLADLVGETPLHHAARNDDVMAAQSLIAAGAEVGSVSLQGWAPLHTASMNGSLAMVAVLLQSGVDVDLENKRSQTPLTCAALKDQIRVVDYLLEHGADPDRTDRRGNTCLHIALVEGHDEVAARLVQGGADVDAVNDAGVTPRKLMETKGKDSLLEMKQVLSSR